jgi:hypothetical protein
MSPAMSTVWGQRSFFGGIGALASRFPHGLARPFDNGAWMTSERNCFVATPFVTRASRQARQRAEAVLTRAVDRCLGRVQVHGGDDDAGSTRLTR